MYSNAERTALIAYGTETGNAFDYAEELGRLVERLHFSAFVTKLDGVDIVKSPKSFISPLLILG